MSPWQPSSAGGQTSGLSTAESDSMSGSKHDPSSNNDVNTSNHGTSSSAQRPAENTSTAPTKRGLFSKSPKRGSANKSQDNSLGQSLTNSAPTVLIHTPSASSSDDPSATPLRRPLRSAMSTRSLHDSLHRGRSQQGGNSPQSKMKRSVSFASVKIREYERILGDNPSVTSGPPLSIGWRYVPEPISMNLDDYETGKGLPRSSSEYLVPKAVRENLLKEHADVSRREMVSAVRTIQKEKAQRRKTVVNLSMQKTEEKLEGAKRKIKKILKPATSYDNLEAKLWDEAHEVAIEKAKRLEDSIRRGESISSRQFYSVGTPCNNILPSRRNSMPRFQNNAMLNNVVEDHVEGGRGPVDTSDTTSTTVGGHAITLESVTQYVPKTANMQIRRTSSAGELDHEQSPSRQQRHPNARINNNEGLRASGNIVISESESEDIFAKLVLDA